MEAFNVSTSLSLLVSGSLARCQLLVRKLSSYSWKTIQAISLCSSLCGCALANGTVTFANPTSASTTAVFSSSGTYTITCTVSDSVLTNKATMTITVSNPVSPALISLDHPSGIAGNTVTTTVTYSTGSTGASGLQFNLAIPAGVTVSTSAIANGAASSAAGKTVSAAVNSGVLTVIIAGLNQNIINSGPLALIPLSLGASLTTQNLALTLSSVLASDPIGTSLPINGQNGTISVTANAAPAVTISGPLTLVLPSSATLTATASDDGAPTPPGALTYQWSGQ